jgi:hypothetical protein
MKKVIVAVLIVGAIALHQFGQGGIIIPTADLLCTPATAISAAAVVTTTTTSDDYSLAMSESLGFFDDISQKDWIRMKENAQSIFPNHQGKIFRGRAGAFFQSHYEPDFVCPRERRIGKLGDGGKWICDPDRLVSRNERGGTTNNKNCLVYSVGSNGDASFEAAVRDKIGCEIHVFDFGDYAEVVGKRSNATYHQWGIDGKSRVVKGRRGETNVFKTLKQTVEELGHEGRVIDIFKIDCEGCELTSFKSWFEANVTLQQILVEVHSSSEKVGERGLHLVAPGTSEFFEELYEKEHYGIFHKEANVQFWQYKPCFEFCFVKLSPSFIHTKASVVGAGLAGTPSSALTVVS